ncbi:hypothetical protein L1887_57810 [Cichorium endivia]|nr:hypothetical protein L1887_57810 [Cichorium endivia]
MSGVMCGVQRRRQLLRAALWACALASGGFELMDGEGGGTIRSGLDAAMPSTKRGEQPDPGDRFSVKILPATACAMRVCSTPSSSKGIHPRGHERHEVRDRVVFAKSPYHSSPVGRLNKPQDRLDSCAERCACSKPAAAILSALASVVSLCTRACASA